MKESAMRDERPPLAPRPAKRSMARSVYDAVDALERATLTEIMTYLPATEDAERWSKAKAKPDYVARQLAAAVYYGYLVTGEGDNGYTYWKVAPLQYYKRQAERRAEIAQSGAGGRRRKDRSARTASVYERDTRYEAMAFFLGFCLGGALCALAVIALG